jgi:hypothetical protein
MGLMRVLGRAGTLALAGAAAGYYMRRKGLLGEGPVALGPPVETPPGSSPEAAPVGDSEPETLDGVVEERDQPEDEPEPAGRDPAPEDAELVAVEVAQPDREAPGEEPLTETEVVVDPSDDERVAEAVRAALVAEPGLLSAPVDIEVESGHVTLRGECERAEGMAAVERKASAVEGVRYVESLLHLAGTPAPKGR